MEPRGGTCVGGSVYARRSAAVARSKARTLAAREASDFGASGPAWAAAICSRVGRGVGVGSSIGDGNVSALGRANAMRGGMESGGASALAHARWMWGDTRGNADVGSCIADGGIPALGRVGMVWGGIGGGGISVPAHGRWVDGGMCGNASRGGGVTDGGVSVRLCPSAVGGGAGGGYTGSRVLAMGACVRDRCGAYRAVSRNVCARVSAVLGAVESRARTFFYRAVCGRLATDDVGALASDPVFRGRASMLRAGPVVVGGHWGRSLSARYRAAGRMAFGGVTAAAPRGSQSAGAASGSADPTERHAGGAGAARPSTASQVRWAGWVAGETARRRCRGQLRRPRRRHPHFCV